MSVVAVCTGCQKAFKAPDEYAGKKVKCKNCGTAFRVPALAAAAAPTAAASSRGSAAPAAARTTASAARPAPARKPVAPPVPDDDDGGEYGLSDDDLGPVQRAPVMPAASAPRQSAAAPALAYASPGVATAGVGAGHPAMTMYPSANQTVAARRSAGGAAAAEGHNWFLYIQLAAFGLPVLLLVLGKAVPAIGTAGVLMAVFVGMAFILWGQIGILIAASQEGTGTLLMYMFIPLYPIFFILSHFEDVSSHVIRTVGGFALIFGSVMIISSQTP